MPRIEFAWPDGKRGALTSSWDDGSVADRRLVGLLNEHGVKATWNLNSGHLGPTERVLPIECVVAAEVEELYSGHEVASHTAFHPQLTSLSSDLIRREVLEDRRALETLVGYPVVGLALPFGAGDPRVTETLRHCGVSYCRSIERHYGFSVPADFLNWDTTCHQSDDLAALWKAFCANTAPDKLFFVWGHSYDFAQREDWRRIETFAKVAGNGDVWHATNIEICDYIRAFRGCRWSVDSTLCQNPTGVTVWFRVDDELLQIPPGGVVQI